MSVNAAQAAKRYQDSMAAPSTKQKYVEGINGTTVNPMALAADAEALYLQRVTEASNSGRRRQKLLAANPATWKANASGKGANRLAEGAKTAADKVQAHFQKWGPIYDSVSSTVNAMPKGGLAEAQARSSKAIEMLMQAAGRA